MALPVPLAIIPPTVRLPAEVVIVTGLAFNVTLPVPKFRLFEPVKVKLPFQTSALLLLSVIGLPLLLLMVVPSAIVNVPAVAPRAVLLLMVSVPAGSVFPPAYVFVPERVSAEPALFSVTVVTFEPILPLIVVPPVLLPELVIVPVLLTDPLSPIVPTPFALSVRLPVLVQLPESVLLVATWFQVTGMAPENVPAPVEPSPIVSVADDPLLVMVTPLVTNPSVWARPLISKMPVPLVVRLSPLERLPAAPSFSVPALTVVRPV